MAKLTKKDRDKLPKSAFCGPNRRFPVPDRSHATAAQRLVGRANLSTQQKNAVMACVARKIKLFEKKGK